MDAFHLDDTSAAPAAPAHLLRLLAQRERELGQLTEKLGAAEARLLEQRRIAAVEKSGTIAVFHRSTSWRLTLPLRLMSAGLRWIVTRLVPPPAVAPVPVPRAPIDHAAVAASILRQRNGNRPSRAGLAAGGAELGARFFTRLPSGDGPLISLLMPAWNSDPALLAAAVDSVLAQHWRRWELLIADDGSSNPASMAALDRAAARDPRIRLVRLTVNGGISAASNAALVAAKGDFVGLLDHDDTLDPVALLEAVRAMTLWPELDWIYTDEDKLAADGGYHSPYYKPDWSPELLLSTMYTGHFTLYRTALVRQVGGFRSAYDGTQDYDLALRMAEVTDRVCHLPMVLYHWRESATSSAGNLGQKSGAVVAQRRALEDTLVRRDRPGRVLSTGFPGNWRIRYATPEEPLVSIVIPSATREAEIDGERVNLAVHVVESILARTAWRNFEIILVHNTDIPPAIRRRLATEPKLRLMEYDAEVFNLADKLNQGAAAARGEFVLLLNDDIEVIERDWIGSMVAAFAVPDIGVVGAKLYYGGGQLQHLGVVWIESGPTHALIGRPGHDPGPHIMAMLRRDVLGVTGACQMVRREVYQRLGGYDPKFPLNYNDVDFCLRARELGLRVVIDPQVRLRHFESISKSGIFKAETEKLLARWGQVEDPFFNLNYDRSNPNYEGELRHPDFPIGHADWLELETLARRTSPAALAAGRRFSIITGVYNTPPRFLDELAETVLAQTHADFEWLLVDDQSSDPATLAVLDVLAARDPRIRRHRLAEHGGILGGLRAGLDLASGDWIMPVDHDDLLTADALALLDRAIGADPAARILFTDEDKADPMGQRVAPFLKPDFDPVLLLNACYVTHLHTMERATALALDVYGDRRAEGCHDWDSFRRFIAAGHLPRHVPAVTYAWRMHAGSTASGDAGVKPYTTASQRHVLDGFLAARGIDATHEVVHRAARGMWTLRARPALPLPPVALLRRLPAGWAVQLVDPAAETPPEAGGEGFATLGEALRNAAASARIVAYHDPSLRMAPDWLADPVGLLTGIAEAGIVGGRIGNSRHLIDAGLYAGFAAGRRSPFAGLPLGDPGYFGLAECQRRIDFVAPLLWCARANAMQPALAAAPEGLEVFLLQLQAALHAAGGWVLHAPGMAGTAPGTLAAELYRLPPPAPAGGAQFYPPLCDPDLPFAPVRRPPAAPPR